MNSTPDPTYPRLLGDIGGTNARFAWAVDAQAPLSDIAQYPCNEHVSLRAAIEHYLQAHGKPLPAACGIGIANPITADQVKMTNHHWSFSISQLKAELALSRLAVINDFTALALSLPHLSNADVKQIGVGNAVSGEPLVVLGAGTGLGVSALLTSSDGKQVSVISGEGGHVSLAAADDQEAAIIEILRGRFPHVSAERALSGPGLVNLYEACSKLAQHTALPLTPSDVITRSRAGNDPCCQMAIDFFCRFLGGVAGNLALTFGARGGVYIGGGIAPRLLQEITHSRFRERFEAKGVMEKFVHPIPTFIIDPLISPALIGASRAIDMDRFCAS